MADLSPPVGILHLPNLLALNRIARVWASHFFTRQSIVHLTGELGAGKTTFARHLISAMGYSGTVNSPSYALLETYVIKGIQVFHSDLYRLSPAGSISLCLEIEEQLDRRGSSPWLVLLEWPNNERHGQSCLSFPDFRFDFSQRKSDFCGVIHTWMSTTQFTIPEPMSPFRG